MRVRHGRPLSLRHTFLDESEENALTLTAVTATLFDAFTGAEVDSVSASAPDSVEWVAEFPAQPMGRYEVKWIADSGLFDITDVEVVGGFLFTVTEARNSDEFLRDPAEAPAAEILHYRDVVEQEFQQITSRSFTTRVERRRFLSDGSGEFFALLPDAQAIESVEIEGVPVADLTGWHVSRLGVVTAPNRTVAPVGVPVVIAVRYGYSPAPPDVKRVAMVRLRFLMAAEQSGIPDRAVTWQPDDGGTFRLATPGAGKWRTGIPEVDSTLSDYSLDIVLALSAIG